MQVLRFNTGAECARLSVFAPRRDTAVKGHQADVWYVADLLTFKQLRVLHTHRQRLTAFWHQGTQGCAVVLKHGSSPQQAQTSAF